MSAVAVRPARESSAGAPRGVVRLGAVSAGVSLELRFVESQLFAQLGVESIATKPIENSSQDFAHGKLEGSAWKLDRETAKGIDSLWPRKVGQQS